MMSFSQRAGRHLDADSVSGCPLHRSRPRPDSGRSASVVAPGNHNNRLARTPNEPCRNAADVVAIGRAVTVCTHGDEVALSLCGNRQQLGGRVAVEHDRKECSGGSTAELLDPMLEREIGVTAKNPTRRFPM